MKKILLFLVAIFCTRGLFAQNTEYVSGRVLMEEDSKLKGAFGVEVYWQGSNIGVTTDKDGSFSIAYNPFYKNLVFSYLGFKTEVVFVSSTDKYINITLTSEVNELESVEVSHKRKGTERLSTKTANIVQINSGELLKAACCSLSDSFETNAAVDVSLSDAIGGAKQIKMLGLSSPYILMTQENIPSIRGASEVYGMSFIPGTWVDAIQIIKGSGSVINGYESIAGQINTELVKPMLDKPLFLNLFASNDGNMELNSHWNNKISDKWYAGLYTHGNMRKHKMDTNGDGFMDMPTGQQINLMNRWQYANTDTGWESNILLSYLADEKTMGEMNFSQGSALWGSKIRTNQFQGSVKFGYVWRDMPYQSIGFQGSYKHYKQNSFFGLRTYDISQQSAYFNTIFTSIIDNHHNKFFTGLSLYCDAYRESLSDISNTNMSTFDRDDRGVGAFFEYSFDNQDNLSLTAGLRADYHNRMDFFLTPRLNLRYGIWGGGTLRASVGMGRRVANIFSENQKFLFSSRKVNIKGDGSGAYNLNAEKAWNYGVSFSQKFELFGRGGDFGIDFYRTDFKSQVVVDWDSPGVISFYNLSGKSFASTVQVDLNYELLENLNLRTAYKFYDVQTDFSTGRREQVLQAKNRFFSNLSYDTASKGGRQWRFDTTFNLVGRQRLADTSSNPLPYTMGKYSESYFILNGQITRVFSPKVELYLGGENLLNYRQKNAIIDPENPFGGYFDSSIVYAPVSGTMIYLGLRWTLL